MKLLSLLLLLWLPLPLHAVTTDALSPPFCVKKAAQKSVKPTPKKAAPKAARAKPTTSRASAPRSTRRAVTAKRAGPSRSSRTATRKSSSRNRVTVRKSPVRQAAAAPYTDPSQPPSLHSHAALVMRHDTGEVLYAKNSGEPQSIASVTKLMTAIVVMDQGLALNEQIRISEEDVDTLKNSRSRVPVGTTLSREELLLLALMSSENRAASALARTSVPGGLPRFIEAMNRKAQVLGMHNTRFRDPTGLNPGNISTASDLAKMAQAAYQHPLIRRMTTTPESEVYFPNRHLPMEYRNTNSLVRNQLMAVGLSKTGYIREAGRCLVMQANLADDPYLMVFLGSASHAGPAQDALKLERWLTYRRQQGG